MVREAAISELSGKPFSGIPKSALFPVRRTEQGGGISKTDKIREKAIALLLIGRENLVNAVSFASSDEPDENLIYQGVMEIEINGKKELYAYTAQNAKPFADSVEMVQKGLIANGTTQKGFSLRGQGMKLPQAYINSDNACELVLCSKTPVGFRAAVSRYASINVQFESNETLDEWWDRKLRARFGDKIYDKCNNFILHKISPFFSKSDAILGALRMHMHDLCASLMERVTVYCSEGVMDEGSQLEKANANTFLYRMHTAKDQQTYFVCKDDKGEASVADSIWTSEEKRIVIEDSKIKLDLGVVVTIEPLPMLMTQTQIKHLYEEDGKSSNAFFGTLRSGPRSEKVGSGNENSVMPLLHAFFTASAIATENPELSQLSRFIDGPIAFLRENQMGDVYRALGLPVYPKLIPRLKTKTGKMAVHAKPILRVKIDICKVHCVTDKEVNENSGAISLVDNLSIRGDFVMPHNTSGSQYLVNLRDQIIDESCRAVADDLKSSWVPDWCKERYEKVEPNLYKFKASLCETGSKKEARHITKYDLEAWASEYKLNAFAGMEKFVAFQDDITGKFLSAQVDAEYHSVGCYTQQIHIPFDEYLLNWAESRKAAVAHAVSDPKERREKIREISALEKNLLESYKNLCKNRNAGEPITMYHVNIDQLALIDSSKRLIPFDGIERTPEAVEELVKKSS